MLKQLQQENYALKGAQFTFEFPVHSSDTNTATTAAASPPKHETYTTSGSSMSSSNSYSGEETNSQLSPLSNTHTHEDDSTSADTPIANLFSTEPMQFGLIQPSETNLDFLSVSNNYPLGNQMDTTMAHNMGTPSINNVDLFHGKDDLFTNYRTPSTTNDDFLFANEDLSSLFGGNNELFGFNNNQFAFDQTSLGVDPVKCSENKRQFMLDTLKKGQKEGKYIYQVHQEIKQQCPTFDIDALCDELKQKATCSLSQHPLTDYDVQAFVKCLDRRT